MDMTSDKDDDKTWDEDDPEEIARRIEQLANKPSFMIGLPLFLSLEECDRRLACKTTVQGWCQDDFFIVETPMINGKEIHVDTEDPFTVRYVLDGVAYKFDTYVYRRIMEPKRLLLLKYPKELDTRVLRRHNRLQMMLPVTINGQDHDAIIADLSAGGALIDCPAGFMPPQTKKIRLGFLLPDGNEIAALVATIKSFSESSDSVSLRVLFDDDQEDKLQLIRNFIRQVYPPGASDGK